MKHSGRIKPSWRDRVGLVLLGVSTIPGSAGIFYMIVACVAAVFSRQIVNQWLEWAVWLSLLPGLGFIIGLWNSRLTLGMGHWQFLIAIPSILIVSTVLLAAGLLCCFAVAWGD